MKTLLYFCIVLLFAAQAFAQEINWPGESAHIAGGVVVAGTATAIADKYWPEHRALIRFSVSTASGIIGEGIDRATYGEKSSSILQDIVFHTLGAAIGSLITDKFILTPVIKRDHPGSNYSELAIQYHF